MRSGRAASFLSDILPILIWAQEARWLFFHPLTGSFVQLINEAACNPVTAFSSRYRGRVLRLCVTGVKKKKIIRFNRINITPELMVKKEVAFFTVLRYRVVGIELRTEDFLQVAEEQSAPGAR